MDPLITELGKTLGIPGLFIALLAFLLNSATRERQETNTRFIAFLEKHSMQDLDADQKIADMIARSDERSIEQNRRIVETIERLGNSHHRD